MRCWGAKSIQVQQEIEKENVQPKAGVTGVMSQGLQP